jgi:hypothetical protein
MIRGVLVLFSGRFKLLIKNTNTINNTGERLGLLRRKGMGKAVIWSLGFGIGIKNKSEDKS